MRIIKHKKQSIKTLGKATRDAIDAWYKCGLMNESQYQVYRKIWK